MENRTCKNCSNIISEGTRTGAIYCSPKCGWSFRNKKNRSENLEKRKALVPYEKNYKIIKDCFKRGIFITSKESLISKGFDFNAHMGIIGMNPIKGSTEYKIFEFSFNITAEKIELKKYNNGRI